MRKASVGKASKKSKRAAIPPTEKTDGTDSKQVSQGVKFKPSPIFFDWPDESRSARTKKYKDFARVEKTYFGRTIAKKTTSNVAKAVEASGPLAAFEAKVNVPDSLSAPPAPKAPLDLSPILVSTNSEHESPDVTRESLCRFAESIQRAALRILRKGLCDKDCNARLEDICASPRKCNVERYWRSLRTIIFIGRSIGNSNASTLEAGTLADLKKRLRRSFELELELDRDMRRIQYIDSYTKEGGYFKTLIEELYKHWGKPQRGGFNIPRKDRMFAILALMRAEDSIRFGTMQGPSSEENDPLCDDDCEGGETYTLVGPDSPESLGALRDAIHALVCAYHVDINAHTPKKSGLNDYGSWCIVEFEALALKEKLCEYEIEFGRGTKLLAEGLEARHLAWDYFDSLLCPDGHTGDEISEAHEIAKKLKHDPHGEVAGLIEYAGKQGYRNAKIIFMHPKFPGPKYLVENTIYNYLKRKHKEHTES